MAVALLIIFSLVYIVYFVRKSKRKQKEAQIRYDEEWSPYDIWDDES